MVNDPMSRLWPEGEEIEVVLDAEGWPEGFAWLGRRHPIERLLARWQVQTDWWSEEGEVHREYLKITTTDGLLCEIFFDLIHERWCLARLYD